MIQWKPSLESENFLIQEKEIDDRFLFFIDKLFAFKINQYKYISTTTPTR